MTGAHRALPRPCLDCEDGDHPQCAGGGCGCIAFHPDDPPFVRGFKMVKQKMHPERETWTVGGWGQP